MELDGPFQFHQAKLLVFIFVIPFIAFWNGVKVTLLFCNPTIEQLLPSNKDEVSSKSSLETFLPENQMEI